jgi:hypothetical protein
MTKRQSIFRADHGKQNPYFQMLRTTAQDETLSFEARGVIAYLLSQDEKWEINKTDLMKRGGIGKSKLTRIVNELIETGYMIRTQENIRGEFQKTVYTLYEEPQAENRIAVPSPEPVTEKPVTGNRVPGNQPQDIIKEKSTIEDTTIDQKIAPDGAKGEKPVQYHIAIIDAYWAGLPGGKPIRATYARHSKVAVEFNAAGITPDDVTQFLAAVYDPGTDKFDYKKWHDKPIPLEVVADMIPLWKAANAPPPPLEEIDFGSVAEWEARRDAYRQSDEFKAARNAVLEEAGHAIPDD